MPPRQRYEVTIDPYTYYEFKEALNTVGHGTGNTKVAPSWVPPDDLRRLASYKLVEAYYRNAARNWMKSDAPQEVVDARREYGDAKTIRDAILSSLLGDDMSFLVSGAEQTSSGDRNEQSQALAQKLLEWRIDERFDQKVIECERGAVGIGDGVYALSWDERNRRPKLTVYDAGFYFPELDPSANDEYPETICMAWQYELGTPEGTRQYVRRLKWYMGQIVPHDEFGFEVEEEDENSVLFGNETVNEEGQILRQYPWNRDPVAETCYFSDYTWDLSTDTGSRNGLFDLDEGKAIVSTPEVDLQLDYIPVIHVPNTVALQEHFGVGCIAQVVQILDDLMSTDTDLQASSATTGSPPIALSGSSAPKEEDGTLKSYGPGTVFETGDGTATMIDTSRSLDALIKYKDSLQSRLAINSRVPESLLGKVKPNEVPSGIALTLSFTPHSQLIKEMRLVRTDKYRLLLKFVSRMYWYNDEIDITGELPRIEMIFGSFLPADKQEVVSLISTLLQTDPPAISLESAVRMLMEAGFPIEDAIEEIEAIETRDYEGANKLLEATGDIVVTRTYLKLGPPPPGTLPTEDEEGVPPPPAPGR